MTSFKDSTAPLFIGVFAILVLLFTYDAPSAELRRVLWQQVCAQSASMLVARLNELDGVSVQHVYTAHTRASALGLIDVQHCALYKK